MSAPREKTYYLEVHGFTAEDRRRLVAATGALGASFSEVIVTLVRMGLDELEALARESQYGATYKPNFAPRGRDQGKHKDT